MRHISGELASAIADYDRAIELDPASGAGWLARGDLRYRQGDLEGATLDFRRAIEIEPARVDAHLALARTSMARGDHAGALARLDDTLRLEPAFLAALRLRADVLDLLGRADEALRDRARARALDPEEE
ncbi:MAG: tetratricopeptide repeat protein [Planctomycetes bacterium]|nr:tetratricopeptide repeat protein [Planctomycetota bacterium]